MAARQVAAATMPWAHPDFGGEVMHLKLAPGTVSGFKGVHKAAKKWEARRWVAGRGTRVVWRSESAKECAFILARLELYPCEIPTPKKGRAKPGEGRSRADASVRVSQPQAARKRQKRAAARESLACAKRRVPELLERIGRRRWNEVVNRNEAMLLGGGRCQSRQTRHPCTTAGISASTWAGRAPV